MLKRKNGFSVNHVDLEKQHQKLFKLKAEMQEIVKGDMNFEGFRKNDEISYLIHSLSDYSKYHFEHENMYCKLHDSSQPTGHQLENKRFMNYLSDIKRDIYSDEYLQEITRCLSNWIENHIKQQI